MNTQKQHTMKYLQLLFLCLYVSFATAQNITIVSDPSSPRAKFGAEKLSETLSAKGFSVTSSDKFKKSKDKVIVIGEKGTDFWKKNAKR